MPTNLHFNILDFCHLIVGVVFLFYIKTLCSYLAIPVWRKFDNVNLFGDNRSYVFFGVRLRLCAFFIFITKEDKEMQKAKKLFSILLAILVLMSMMTVAQISTAASTSHTQAEAVNWIKARANEGWWKDVDGAYGCQCVDLIKAYYQYWGYDTTRGNAWEYKSGHLPAGSNWYYSGTPVPGSVFVKDKDSTWTMGHVGLVYAVEGSTIYTVETNVASPYDGGYPHAKATYKSHPKSYAVTFINPTFSNPVPTITDKQAPTISNIYQNDFSSSGYTLHFTATDNIALDYANIYTTATGQNQQGERINLSGTSQSVSYSVKYSKFNNVKTGYRHGIWIFDKAGNVYKSEWINVDYDDEIPVISKVYATDFSPNGFNLIFTASDNKELQKAIVYTNVNNKNQKGQEIALSGKSRTVSVSIKYSDFNNAISGYKHGIWLYDKSGNVNKSPWYYIENETEEPKIKDVKILNKTDEGYTLNYTVSDNSSLSYVRVYTWTKASNQKSVDISLEGKDASLSYYVKYSDFDNDKSGYIHGIWLFDGNGNKYYSPYLYVDELIKTEEKTTEPTTNNPTQPVTNEPTDSTAPSTTEPITTVPSTNITEPTVPLPSIPEPTSPSVIEKKDISAWDVLGLTNKTYTGKAVTQKLIVTDGKEIATVKSTYTNNKKAGSATIAITGTGVYTGTIVKTFKITKASNPVKITAKKIVTAKAKKKTTIKKAIIVKKAKGKVTYKTNNKKVTVKSGNLIISKGLKKGKTYKVKITITAKGNSNFKSKKIAKTIKIKVK